MSAFDLGALFGIMKWMIYARSMYRNLFPPLISQNTAMTAHALCTSHLAALHPLLTPIPRSGYRFMSLERSPLQEFQYPVEQKGLKNKKDGYLNFR